MIDVIRVKLQKARENKDMLEVEFQDLEEKLRDVEKLISKTEGEIGALQDLLKDVGVVQDDGENGTFVGFYKDNESESAKKPRAQRATKEVMRQRFLAVGKIFLEEGDLTVKDLEPLLNNALGYELEAHRQRGILYRYPKMFEPKEEHGIWGLTIEGRTYFEELDDELDTE